MCRYSISCECPTPAFGIQAYAAVQIVVYNKMDVSESADYWPDIQQSLETVGIAQHLMCPISAVSGQGVLDLIRMVHAALDELPARVQACLTGPPYAFLHATPGLLTTATFLLSKPGLVSMKSDLYACS